MDCTSIDLLEKRIEALELIVLPKDVYSFLDNKSQALTDLLLQTQTMIASALSCREAIKSILGHMETINEFLDPCHGETEFEIEAKRHYLLELYPELKETIEMIGTVEMLIPYTDSANIMKVTELSDKLEQLVTSHLDIYADNREVTQNVLKSLQEYHDITASMKVLFAQLDRAVNDMEMALQAKVPVEE